MPGTPSSRPSCAVCAPRATRSSTWAPTPPRPPWTTPSSPTAWPPWWPRGEVERGLLVCGTGLGVCMAANRHRGVRAADCFTPHLAEMSRRHNDANVLCLGGRLLERGRGVGHHRGLDGDAVRGRSSRASRRAHRRGGRSPREPGRPRVASRAALSPRSRAQRTAAQRAHPPAGDARAHRQRELRQPRGARGHGLGAHQQVRRGPPGGALLRRLRDRRPGRAAGHRPLQGACSGPSTSTCSRTRAPRPTWPRCSPCSSPATR